MEEVLSSVAGVRADTLGSSDDLDPEDEEEGENESKGARKKKNKRRKGTFSIIFELYELFFLYITNNFMFVVCLAHPFRKQ